MICPVCRAWVSIKETRARPQNNSTYRRYECANEHRFTTTESLTKVIEKPKQRKGESK